MTEEEKELQNKLRIPNCQFKKWRHAWAGGHTPEIQAQFVKKACEKILTFLPDTSSIRHVKAIIDVES